jgi:hypothetical protein
MGHPFALVVLLRTKQRRKTSSEVKVENRAAQCMALFSSPNATMNCA